MAGISLGDLWQKYQDWRGGPSMLSQLGQAFPQPLDAGRPGQTVAAAAPPPTSLAPSQWDALSRFNFLAGIKAYHGAAAPFEKIDPEMFGATSRDASARRAFWLTDDPSEADTYARIATDPEGYADSGRLPRGPGHVVETTLEPQKPYEFDFMEEAKKVARQIGVDEPTDIREATDLLTGGDVTNVRDQVLQEAQHGGHDLVIFKNIADNPAAPGTTSTHYAVLDPSIVRFSGGIKVGR